MTFDPKTDALLVIDVQKDFLPGGALAVTDGDKVIAPILALGSQFKTVVITQDFHPRQHISFASAIGRDPFTTVTIPGDEKNFVVPRVQALWPDHCVAGTEGAKLDPTLKIGLNPVTSLVLRKGTSKDTDSYSAFFENENPSGVRPPTGLGAWLRARGIKRVFCVGLAYDFCVAWSAKDAKREGFESVVIENCTRAVFPQNDAATKLDLVAAGVTVLAEV